VILLPLVRMCAEGASRRDTVTSCENVLLKETVGVILLPRVRMCAEGARRDTVTSCKNVLLKEPVGVILLPRVRMCAEGASRRDTVTSCENPLLVSTCEWSELLVPTVMAQVGWIFSEIGVLLKLRVEGSCNKLFLLQLASFPFSAFLCQTYCVSHRHVPHPPAIVFLS
jgi:hypothetical protein